MFYKETGQFKSRYKDELAAFPLFEDKIGIGILCVLTFFVIQMFGLQGLNYEFAMGAILIHCMIFIIIICMQHMVILPIRAIKLPWVP